jgi:hypothetical protein
LLASPIHGVSVPGGDRRFDDTVCGGIAEHGTMKSRLARYFIS